MAKSKVKYINQKIQQEKDLFENIWLCLLILLVFWLIFFSQILLGKAFLWDDFSQQYFPSKTMSAVTLNSGDFPFWNPYSFSGMPFFANLEIAVLYPFNYFLRYFVSGDHLSPVLLEFTIVFHYLLCSVFTFFLGKQLKFSNASSVLFAILFTYSSYMMIHMIHMANLEAVSWFPLIFLLWLKYMDSGKYLFIILAGTFMGLCILTGYPQVAFFNYLFLSVYIFIILFTKFKEKNFKFCWKIVIAFFLFLIIPFGIASVQLLPTNEFVSLSNRATFDYDFAKQGSVHPLDFVTFFVPKVFGVWSENSALTDLKYWAKHSEGVFMFSISNIFTSALAVVIFIPSIIYALKKKINFKFYAFLTGVIVFTLLFALGGNFFLHKLLFDTLPVFNRFRNPGHILYLFTFSASIIIAFGFNEIMKKSKEIQSIVSSKFLIILVSTFILILLLVVSGFFKPSDIQNKEIQPWITKQYIVFFVFFISYTGLIYLFLKGKATKNLFAALVIVLLLGEVYYIWFDINNGSRNPETLISQNIQDVMKLKEELKNEYFRVSMRKYFPEGGSYSHFQRNLGMVERVPLIEGYGALLLNKMYPFNKANFESTQSHDLMNVKYDIDVDKANNKVAFKLNPEYLPRARMFFDIKVFENDSAALRKYMESKEFDYKKTLVLEKNPQNISLHVVKDSLQYPKSNVKITEFKNDKIIIDAETSEDGFLFLSEEYYPAWKCLIDEKETEIFRTDFCLRSVYLKKGIHKVEFIYESDSFSKGKLISIFILSLTLISIIFFSFKERFRKNTNTG